MHRCLKCGRTITNVAEINEGCQCGSKVFVFIKSEAEPPSQAPLKHTELSIMNFGPKEGASGERAVEDAPVPVDGAQAPTKPESEIPMPEIISAPEPALPEKKDIEIIPPHESSSQQAPPETAMPLQQENSEPEQAPQKLITPATVHEELCLARGAKIIPVEGGNVENIRQITKGVYEVDVGALSDGPVVVMDDEGVYYVRLPFKENKMKADKGGLN